jgi:hypothetical protein
MLSVRSSPQSSCSACCSKPSGRAKSNQTPAVAPRRGRLLRAQRIHQRRVPLSSTGGMGRHHSLIRLQVRRRRRIAFVSWSGPSCTTGITAANTASM